MISLKEVFGLDNDAVTIVLLIVPTDVYEKIQ